MRNERKSNFDLARRGGRAESSPSQGSSNAFNREDRTLMGVPLEFSRGALARLGAG